MFVIKFKIGAGDEALGIFHPVDSGEELVEGLLHESVVFADHGVGLARACLSVDKDAGVVTIEDVV